MRTPVPAAMRVVAALVLCLAPALAGAQKALVYCPVGIDVGGCDVVAAALAPSFPAGVDRGYDGSGGTVDLRTGDLWAYGVVVVPSFAETAELKPYGLLRQPAVAERMRDALMGRVAMWSGTPDQGSANRDRKDALIRSLASWASGNYAAVKGPGLVALQDLTDSVQLRYDWVQGIAKIGVVADEALNSYSAVQTMTATGLAILAPGGGSAMAYDNMASYGFYLPDGAAGISLDAVGQISATKGGQVVLLTSPGGDNGTARIKTDRNDYAPGSIVTITGSGFKPGESVTLTLHEEPKLEADETLTATADGAGNFVNTSFSPDAYDVDVRFILTATGSAGSQAQTTFTDGNNTFTSVIAPTSSAAAATQDYTVTVTNTSDVNNASKMGSANVTVPSGFTSVSVVGVTPPTGKAWTATYDAPSGTVRLRATTTASSLAPAQNGQGERVAVVVRATAPSPAAPTNFPWTTDVKEGISFPANGNGSQTWGLSTGATQPFVSVSPPACAAPAIATQPANASATALATATFSVTATGTAPLAYQWRRTQGGTTTSITGATAASYTTPSLLSTDDGSSYSVFVTNPCGSVTSSSATLTVTRIATHIAITWTGGTYTGSAFAATAKVLDPTNADLGIAPTITYFRGTAPADTIAANAIPGAPSGVGSYIALAKYDGSTKYAPSTAGAPIVISPAPLTAAANSASRVVGAPNPAFTGTLTGALAGDNITVSYATDALQTSAVGSYRITPVLADPGSKLGNYLVTKTEGVLTIGQAATTTTIVSAAPNPADYNATVTVTYAVAVTLPGSGTPAGTVTVKNGAATLCAGTLPATSCTFAASTAGALSLVATYDGGASSNFSGSTSAAVPLTVKQGITAVTNVAATASVYLGSTTLSATVAPAKAGSVAFYVNGVSTPVAASYDAATGAATLSGYTHGLNASPGGYAVRAVFTSADANFAGSETANASALVVGKAAATLALDAATLTQTYDGSPRVVTFTTSPSPLAGVSLTYAGNAAAPTGAGSYPVVASLDNANYQAPNATGTLVVAKADQTLAWTAPAAITYGTALSATQLAATRPVGDGALTYDPAAGTVLAAGSHTLTVNAAETANYKPATTSVSLTVQQASLTAAIAAAGKTYDATTAATITSCAVAPKVGSDDVGCSATNAQFASASAGQQTVTANVSLTGSSAANYSLANATASTTATIAQRAVTGVIAAASRTYDATTSATITSRSLTGAVAGDPVSLAGGSATFADKTVANGKTVTATGLTLDGASAPNYALASSTVTTTASITARAITVTATGESKVYDGTATATVTLADDRIAGDVLSTSYTTAQFDTPAAGAGRTVTVSGITISGADAGNYALGSATATTTAAITRKDLTITASSPAAIRFGDAAPAIGASYAGFVVAENETSALSAQPVCSTTYAVGANVGTYPATCAGAAAGNYLIAYVAGSLTVDKATPVFASLAAPAITYGDGSATVTGTLRTPNGAYPATGSVTVTVGAIGSALSGSATIGADGAFSATVSGTAALPANLAGYPVAVSYAGGPNFTTASDNALKLVVNKAQATIAVTGGTFTYDAAAHAASATMGGVNGATLTSPVATFTYAKAGGAASAAAPVDAGTYTVTGSYAGDDNYLAASGTATITITPAPLTITVDPKSRTYGDANPAFTGAVTTSIGSDGITATYASAATPATPVGTYPIVATIVDPNSRIANYALSKPDGVLTITKAALSITADDKARLFGAANPSLTGTIVGIKNGDGITASYTTSATNLTSVGSYDIVPAAVDATPAMLGNYALTLVNGKLAIGKATPSITWSGMSSSMPQGDALSAAQLDAVADPVVGPAPKGTVTYTLQGATVVAGTPVYGFGPYPVVATFTSTDGNYTNATLTKTLTVNNVNPVVTQILLNAAPIPVGTSTSVTAKFTDAGKTDTHTAVIDWEGSTTSGTVAESNGAGTVSGSKTYTAAGVYTVKVTVTDNNGGSGLRSSEVETIAYVVVYDPSAGFVTGGGWINSPTGACRLASCTDATVGKANFGFNAKYQKGANAPDGNTEFQFQAGNLNFKSATYSWLVVSGTKAQYKGAGTLNGASGYTFLLTAIDGDTKGNADAFRMKIMDSAGTVVYDNQMGALEDSPNATILGGGSIVIHP